MKSIYTLMKLQSRHLFVITLLLISISAFSQNDSWTVQPSTGNFITSRRGAVSFTIGNKAYVGTGDGFRKDFWEYDPASGAWSQKADFGGGPRMDASGFSIGNKGYIGMGMSGPDTRDIQNDFWEYDLASNNWVRKANVLGPGRFAGVGFAVNGKGYIGMGYDWFTIYSDVEEYNPASNTWANKAYIDTGFYGGISFTIGNKAYLGLGVKGKTMDIQTNEFLEFDPSINKFTRLADFAGDKRVFGLSFPLGGKGYVTSGLSSANDLWQYDPISNRWLRKTDIPGNSTASAFAFNIGDKGYVGISSNGSPVIWRYQINTADTIKLIYTGQTFINLDWENFNSTNSITSYDVYVNGVKKYTTAESEITADNLLPDTSYTFTVIGKDAIGNSTSPSNPVVAKTTGAINGLNYRYYEGNWDQLPNFNTLTPAKSGISATVDISTRTSGINDHFGFVWEGILTVPTPGKYTFETVSDDGSRFYFNSFYNPSLTPLINNDGIHDPWTPVAASVQIAAAGQYPVAISYFEKEGGASIQLYWTGPPGSGITRQLIPNAAFTGNYAPLTDSISPSVPANLKALIVARNFINLDWDNATDNSGVAFYDVYVNGTKKYTTTVSEIKVDSLTENAAYTFTVKARDIAGNNSAFSNTINATAVNVNTGLSYRYYEGNWNSLPDFNSLTPLKSGISANADISVRPSGVFDHFGFVWEGTINIKTPGNYTFETLSDDGSRIYFNSLYSLNATPVVNNDGVHGPWTPVTGMVTIPAAGQYPIAISFFEKDSGELLQLYWTGPAGSGINRQMIPDMAFKGNYIAPTDTIAPAPPATIKALAVSRNSISLDWDNSTDNSGIASYDIYVNGLKKYTTNVSDIFIDSLVENTVYTFTITARDIVGNNSGFSVPATFTTTKTNYGLNYRYYEGNWNSLPDFDTLTPVKTGLAPNADISIRPAGVNDHFAFVWEGTLTIRTPGNYTFETVSDDGSRLYFNSKYLPSATPVLNNDGIHGPWAPVSASVTIPAAGEYPLALTYFEKDGGEAMQVYFTGPPGSGIVRQLIPDAAFRGYFPPNDIVAPTIPVNVKVLATSIKRIALDWDNSTDNSGVIYYDVYVDGVKKYSTFVSGITIDSLVANTAYTFTIKARDDAGNISAFSVPLTASTDKAKTGLSYRYYEGNWNSLPDFTAITPVKTGFSPNVDISVRPAAVNDHFGFVWEGNINIPTPGDYTFETVSDDGSRLYFNSLYTPAAIPLVNNDGLHGPWSPVAGTVNIPAAGQYPFSLSYFEKDGGETMQVYWTGPAGSGINRQLIPDSAFIIKNAAIDAPQNLSILEIIGSTISMSWDYLLTRPEVARYDIYINGIKTNSTNLKTFTASNLTPNTTYTFKVTAVDSLGNSSFFSNEVSAATQSVINAINYKYYEGDWDALPDFNLLTPVKTGTSATVDINVRPAGRDDHFAFVWQGYINIAVPGLYTFETVSDDGSKVYFPSLGTSGNALVNNDGLHPAVSSSGSVFLPYFGPAPITISYFEKSGDQKMELYWSGPGIPRQIVPYYAFVRINNNQAFVQNTNAAVNGLATRSDQLSKDEASVKMYPNPFYESFQVAFNNSNPGNKITVGLYDIAGRLVFNRNLGNLSTGNNLVTIKADDKIVLPGVYFARLIVNGKILKTFKMIKI